MYRYIGLIFIFLFSGCYSYSKESTPVSKQKSIVVDESENALILKALYLETTKHPKEAQELFAQLYEKTENIEYKIRQISLALQNNSTDEAIREGEKLKHTHPENLKLYRILAYGYYQQKEYAKARKMMRTLIKKKSQNVSDYEFLALLEGVEKNYNEAIEALKLGYRIEPSDKLAIKIAESYSLYLLDQDKAIATLESHRRIYGCSEKVCSYLLSVYFNANQQENTLEIAKNLFELYHDDRYAKVLLTLYIYKKDLNNAAKVMQKSHLSSDTLLNIYMVTKDLKMAKALSQKLYELTKDSTYLAQYATFLYEATPNKDIIVSHVVQLLDRVVKLEPTPTYLNYLGYLLIDHDIDINRGIKLVQKAMDREKDSPYYIDSLAWGYYKQGKCDEALKLIDRVIEEFKFNDSIVLEHKDFITKCLRR